MKRNVDLTANQMFSSPTFSLLQVIRDSFGLSAAFPWSFERFHEVTSDEELDSGQKEIVLTGNAKLRQEKREMIEYYGGNHCERCGADLRIKPWARCWDLCKPCFDAVESECRETWKFKDDTIARSRDRIVIEMNRSVF